MGIHAIVQRFDLLSQMELLLRIVIAACIGYVIGYERKNREKAAGMRTHAIVCMGAALIMVVSKYGFSDIPEWDASRVAAQIVSGVGFLGAGVIFIRNNSVSGLTTAAGLWAAAIIGLAIGGGFYEGGLCGTVIVLLAELYFSELEYRILDHAPEINLYMEYRDKECLDRVLYLFRISRLKLQNMEITRATGSDKHNACAIFSLRLNKNCSIKELLERVKLIEGVVSVEEL